MCGRFTLTTPPESVTSHFFLKEELDLTPRFNIAPSQQITVVRYTDKYPRRQFAMMRWGLIPSWAENNKVGYRLINAKAETVAEKPAFRSAYAQRSCVIPADGFYSGSMLGRSQAAVLRQNEGFWAVCLCWQGRPMSGCRSLSRQKATTLDFPTPEWW